MWRRVGASEFPRVAGREGDARLSGQRVSRAARLGVRPPSSFLRVGPADRLTTLSPL